MATPFSDSKLWQIVTFQFTVLGDNPTIDDRGNTSSTPEFITISVKMKPVGVGGYLQQQESGDRANPLYECRITAVNGDTGNVTMPPKVGIGDIGTGTLQGKEVLAVVKEVGQSSLDPVLTPVLGAKLSLEVQYRTRRGSAPSI